jgi:RNA polymerase sigma factor (sigma-70 family)
MIVGLRRRYSAGWIARHADDLLAAANVEYAEWVEENDGRPADNPVGWLLRTVQWRAADAIRSEKVRPTTTSLDELVQVADPATPTPEMEAVHGDRRERLAAMLAPLPEKERELVMLVYFGDLSVREAGRVLGWEKSAADRHHRAALEKLRALAGDRALWERGSILVALKAAIDWIRRQLAELGRRVAPAADHASAAASSGGGRLLGACGVAATSILCGLVAGGIAPTGIGAAIEDARPAAAPRSAPVSTGASVTGAELAPQPFPSAIDIPTAEPEAVRTGVEATATPKRRRASAKKFPAATGTQQRETFEVGATAGEGVPTPGTEPAPSTSTSSGSSSGGSSSGSSGSGSSKAATPPGNEFGL